MAATGPVVDGAHDGTAVTAPLAGRYLQVRDLTEALAAPLSAEDQTVQSMPDVSPTKWHRAHTTWFFETFLLGPQLPGYREFHPGFAYLFNSYYENLGARHPRPQRGLLSRPGVVEIGRYRQHADAAMLDMLDADLTEDIAWLVDLGLHHEQQHQELLLMDIKHVLSLNSLRPAYRPSRPRAGRAEPASAGWVEHSGGLCEIGHEGGGFAFDNESPRHGVHLAPFALADRPTVHQVLAGQPAKRGEESWALSEVGLLAPVPRPGASRGKRAGRVNSQDNPRERSGPCAAGSHTPVPRCSSKKRFTRGPTR